MNLEYFFNLDYLAVFFSTAILIFLATKFSTLIDLVDHPNKRKIHKTAVPLIGGFCVYITTFLYLILTDKLSDFFQSLYIASGFLIALGLIDDKLNIKPIWRFSAQILACLFMVYSTGIEIHSFGELLYPNWDLKLSLFSVLITIFGVVGVVNAINMSDGIDGLAIMTLMIPLCFFAFAQNELIMNSWVSALSISLLVVLFFNLSSSRKVFLGNHGSLFLGFALGWILVRESQQPLNNIYPVTALYLVGVAVIDTIYVMVRRVQNGVSPFKADKTHLHHLLLSMQFSHKKSLGVIVTLIITMNVLGGVLLVAEVAESIQFYLFVLISMIYYVLMNRFWKSQNEPKEI